MRILLLTKADVQGCLNLNQLLPRLLPRHSVRVFLGDCLLPGERGNPAADLMTWHDRDFILEELFPRLDALPPFTAPLLTFQGLSRRYGVPGESLRHGEHHERVEAEVRAWRPDLLYCCRYDYILRPEVLERVPSAFNTHSTICGALSPASLAIFAAGWPTISALSLPSRMTVGPTLAFSAGVRMRAPRVANSFFTAS